MKVIHRFWTGGEMPERYQRYGEMWEELNPDWDVWDWDEDSINALPFGWLQNHEAWDYVSRNGAIPCNNRKPEVARATQLADIVAYEIIYNYGGVYVNCDIEPLRPLTPAMLTLTDLTAWACLEEDQWVNNGVLGSPRYDPFWQLVIAELPDRFFGMPDAAMHITTGPHLLTKVATDNPDKIALLPKETFNPLLYTDIPIGDISLAEENAIRAKAIDLGAVGLHWWGHRSTEARI